jgi:hypothetical protein
MAVTEAVLTMECAIGGIGGSRYSANRRITCLEE